MKKTIRVALAFATYTDSELNSFAILLIACLKTNALFPNLPMTIAAFTALLTANHKARWPPPHRAEPWRPPPRTALIKAIRQLAGYISSLAPTLTVSQVWSSGFDVVNTNKTPQPLTQPVFTLDNSMPGQIAVYLQAVPNAKAYQVQFSIGSAMTWQELGIFPNTERIALTGLTAGTVYHARVRAVGGSTQYSDWSAPMSLMAM
jgi:hypothetical protein